MIQDSDLDSFLRSDAGSDEPAAAPKTGSAPPYAGSFTFNLKSITPEISQAFKIAADAYGVDENVLIGIAARESGFNPQAVGPVTKNGKRAVGLMMFMPDTAKEYGIDPTDPIESVMAAAAYMRQSLDRFGGDYRKSIASYNWGRDRSEFDSPDWDKSLPKETSQYLAYVEQFIGADGEPAKGDSFGTARTEDRGFVPDVQDTSEMEAASKPYFGTSSPKSRRPQESLSPTVVGPSAPEDLPTTSKVPVDPKVRAEIYAAWDAADPGKRAMMEAAPGWAGMLARERAGVFKRFDAGKTGAVEQFDPRREARSNRLVGAGENATFADRAAKEAAASGIDPGNEVKFIQGQYGTIGTNRSPIGQMQDELAATRPGAKPEGVVEVASNAIMRGIHQNAGMGSALLAAGAKSIGADGLALDLLRSYFLRQIDAKKYPAQIEDFTKIDSLSDVPVYVLEGVLENAPQLVGTIGSSVIGATLAKKFGAKAVADMAVEQAGKELARRQAIGAAVGAGATSIGMETGSIYGDVAKDTGQERPGVAASFGVVAGALDAIPAFRAATKILGQDTSSFVAKEIFKRYGTEAVKQLRSEGGTEFLQTWIEEAAKTYVDGRPLLTAENLIQAIDAGLKGGLAGAVTGASSQGISDFRNRALIAVDDAAKKAKSDALNKWQSFADAGKRAPQERNAEAKIADISKAETIDEVAAKALEVVNTPVAPATPDGGAADNLSDLIQSKIIAPDLAPTVDAITALENTNVSPSGDSGVVAAGAPASQADQSGPGVGAAGLTEPDTRGSGSVDTAAADSSVPASGTVPQPGGESSPAVEPAKVWYGRRGDGYLTPEDAQRGLGERQRLQGQFDWRIEPTPDGKYRLAGYAPSTAGGTVQPAAPAPTTGVRSGQPAGPAAVAAVPQEREPARAPVAATQAPIPGSEAGNGFKHSGQKGERYRISVMSASNGAVALEKRLPGGTAATFYVGKDGNFVDGDEVNFIDNGQEKLWIPQNDQQREEAIAILDEMGSLALTDPARKAAKDRLRELVTGQASNASSAPTIRPDGTLKAEGDSKALKDRLTAAGIPARSVVSTAGGTVQASAPAYQSVNQSPITFSQGKGGSWFVGGDPATIRDLLRANGITNFLPTKDGAQLPANTDPEVIGAIRMMAEDFKNLSIQELKDDIRQRMGMTQPPKEPKQTRPFRDFLRSVGIRSDIAGDVVGESNRMRANQILPMTFRRNGLNLDALAERALEMGFLTQQDIDNPNDNGGVNRLVEMIKAESRGVRQAPIDEQTSVDAEQAQAEKELITGLDKLGVPASSYADLSVPQMNSMLNRIERRLRDARLRKQQLDVAEESRLEREAIQMADQITLADVSALERRSEMREASLEQFMRALLFTEQEIQDELAKQANQAQSDQAPAGDAATGPQGSAEADAGNTDRASQAGPAGEVDLFGAAPNASQQEANRIRKEREDRERAQQQSAPSPEEFALSGSDRAADVGAARGQGDLLAPSVAKDAQPAPSDPRNNPDAGYSINEPKKAYGIDRKVIGKAVKRVTDKFDAAQTKALIDWIAARPDAARIVANLNEHAGTPWAKQSLEGALTRAAIEEYAAGRKPAFDSFLNAPTAKGLRELLETNGADGAWLYLSREGVVGNSSKPVNSVSSSFIDCNPSKDCAQFCYAAKGNFALGASVRKSELMTWAAQTDPKRLGQLMASEYAATLEFQHQKALRLFDKGDGTDAWLPVIEELNNFKDSNGNPKPIRVQVFSKNPEFLRQVPAMNLRLLSVDKSNLEVARANPDLPIAFVYTSPDQIEFLNEVKNRVQVILPVKMGTKLLDDAEISQLPAWTKPVVCPVDAGRVVIGKNLFNRTETGSTLVTQQGEWNCTRCDKGGGVGCFHKSTTDKALAAFNQPVHNRSDDEVERIVADIRALAGRGSQSERAELLGSLDRIVSAIRAGIDIGTEGTGRPGDAARTGADDGWQPVRIVGRKDPGKGSVGGVEAPRKKYFNAQLDLFANSDPDPSQRGKGIEGAKTRALDAVENLHSTASILAQALSSDYAARQRVSLVGQQVGSSEDLAVLAQVYRDPRFETLRVFFTNDKGQVVSQVGLSSRLPGSATAIVGEDAKAYLSDIAETAKARGATSFYMLHNHPSGLPTPSRADIALTQTYAQFVPGLRLNAHVVIDTNRYSLIDASGKVTEHSKDFGQSAPPRHSKYGHIVFNSPLDVMDLAKDLDVDKDAVTFIVTDGQYRVRGIAALPASQISDNKAKTTMAVRRAVMEHRGGYVFAVSRNMGNIKNVQHLVVDAVLIDGAKATSLGSSGQIPGMKNPFPENRRPRVTADSSPEFAYLRDASYQSNTGWKVGEDAVGEPPAFSRGPFYSSLRQSIEKINAKALPPGLWKDGIRGLLNKGAVKADEVEWSGLNEWLGLQSGKVTKDDVLAFLDANGVRVEEVTLGAKSNAEADKAMEKWGIVVARNPEDPGQVGFIDRDNPDDIMTAEELEEAAYPIGAVRAAMDIESGGVAIGAAGFPKYTQYTLPGGTNYREVLLTLPERGRAEKEALHDEVDREYRRNGNSARYSELLAQLNAATKELTQRKYTSSHWDAPNVLAHIRLNDRTDADGKRVLFVEEMQADKGQEWQKLKAKIAKGTATKADQDRFEFLDKNFPFNATDKWLTLALKRIMVMAAQEGYDRVAFINGEQSAERYSLDKHVGSVTYVPGMNGGTLLATDLGDNSFVIKETNVTPEKVADFVGKDVAEKLMAQPIKDGSHKLTGSGLKVPQGGMRAFYDTIVPNTLKPLLKKVGGGQLETVKPSQRVVVAPYGEYWVVHDTKNDTYFRGYNTSQPWANGAEKAKIYLSETSAKAAAGEINADDNQVADQPGFTITPEMRERLVGGMPLFRAQGQTGGLSVEAARKIIDAKVGKWKNAPRVVVVATPKDLPMAAPDDANGVYHQGTVYIVAGAHRGPGQVLRTLAHEAVAHYGLRGMLGDGYKKFLAQMQMAIKMGNKPLIAIRDDVRSRYDGLTELQEADEIAARAIEMGLDENGEFKTGFGWLKSWFAKIAQFLRTELGILIPVTNLELQGMLVNAQRFVQGRPDGAGVAVEPAPAFARDGTIDVDGVQRPRTNSKGQQIHPTEEGIKNFWRWFKDSAVVDDQGHPLVVYHGTKENFSKFDPAKLGSSTDHPQAELGFFFSPKAGAASGYPYQGGDGKNVMPAYVTLKNPYRMEMDEFYGMDFKRVSGKAPAQAFRKKLEAQGYDGIILGKARDHIDAEEEGVVIAFRPNQIKSATGNTGAFNAGNDDIAFSRGQPGLFDSGQWDVPETGRVDAIIQKFQDGRIDLKRAQDAIIESGKTIDEKFDARLAETLYAGRVAHRSENFIKGEVKELLERMARLNVPMTDLSDFLLARHAPERNKQIAKVNPDMPDGGAGSNSKGELMTTQAAKDYIAALPSETKLKMTTLAALVDKITKGTRELLVAEGLESRDSIQAWEGAYSNYVPLFKDEAQGVSHPIGQGMSVRGSASRRATGSTGEVTNMLAHVLMQREAAITRAEKNRVGLALYGLALSHPNKDFWTTIKPNMSEEAISEELEAMGVDLNEASQGMSYAPTIRDVDSKTGQVVSRPNPLYKNLPGAMVVRVNGEDRVLMFNQENERGLRLAQNLKNLDGLDIANETLQKIVGTPTRWIASVNTQYNPAFGLVNVTRDALGAMVNLSSTQIAGKQLQVAGHVPSAMAGIFQHMRGDMNGEWAKLYEQFQMDGGKTGFKEMFRTADERTKALQDAIDKVDRSKLDPREIAGGLLSILDGFNTISENIVRLSAYKVALDSGLSRAESARLARELTVDFNRKGSHGTTMGMLYAFFNASVQGSARTIKAIQGPAGKSIILGGLALGAMQALMLAAAGYDDDEIPEWVKARGLVIPLGKDDQGQKKHAIIPLPLGLHVLPNTGRALTELALYGKRDMGTKIVNAVGEIAGAFNPMGGANILTADGALKTILPTIFDPLAELATNTNFSGRKIEKDYRETDNRPGFQRARENTIRTASGQAYISVSKAMNTLTGGTDYQRGLASPSPEQIRYVAQVVGGGLLREVEKVANMAMPTASQRDIKVTGIPLAGRFYGVADDEQTQSSRYYKNAKDIDKIESSLGAAKKAGDREAVAEMSKDPLAALVHYNNTVGARLSRLNKMAVQTVNDRARTIQIDRDRTELMRSLNNEVIRMEEKADGPNLAQRMRR